VLETGFVHADFLRILTSLPELNPPPDDGAYTTGAFGGHRTQGSNPVLYAQLAFSGEAASYDSLGQASGRFRPGAQP